MEVQKEILVLGQLMKNALKFVHPCASKFLQPRTTFLLQPPTTNGKFKECLLCIQEQLKSFFFNSSFSGALCWSNQGWIDKKKFLLNPTKLEMLTSVSSVCCVGDCGEGTDWVSEHKKLKWDRHRPKCCRGLGTRRPAVDRKAN